MHSKSLNLQLPTPHPRRGFTVIEFAVVMTIATIITTALIIQHNKWNDYLAVKTQAYELSLLIRQAQIWSLGVREDLGGSGDKFNIGYGVRTDSVSGLNNKITFFADRNGNRKLNVNQPEEVVSETKALSRGVVIEKVCGMFSGVESCSPQNNLNKLDITFLRPDPKAVIKFLKNQSCGGNNSCVDANGGYSPPAKIYLLSPKGNRVVVKVEANGQISIE